MRHKALGSRRIGLFILFSCIVASGAVAQAPQVTAEQKDYVSDVLPYDITTVHDRALSLFDSDARDFYEDYNGAIYDLPEQAKNIKELSPQAHDQFLAFPLVRPQKFYVFLGAYSTMQHIIRDITPLAAVGRDNAALQRYAALPLEKRAQDIYLWSPDLPYWYSEYTYDEKPLLFHSFFIVHLAAVDASHTRVEIVEHQPRVKMGEGLNVDAHGVVGHFHIREVAPTTGDREFLLSCLEQFIDRHVPGRHYFTCRAKGEPEPERPTPFTVP